MQNIGLQSKSLEDTKRYATQIAGLLQPGDVVILEGDLGTGKTQFTKECCFALGYTGVVTSPTYTIANIYPLEKKNILHADFYRVKSEYELEETGLDTYMDSSILLVEWGAKFEELFSDYLKVELAYVEGSLTDRILTLSYKGTKWAERFVTQTFLSVLEK